MYVSNLLPPRQRCTAPAQTPKEASKTLFDLRFEAAPLTLRQARSAFFPEIMPSIPSKKRTIPAADLVHRVGPQPRNAGFLCPGIAAVNGGYDWSSYSWSKVTLTDVSWHSLFESLPTAISREECNSDRASRSGKESGFKEVAAKRKGSTLKRAVHNGEAHMHGMAWREPVAKRLSYEHPRTGQWRPSQK